MHSFCALFLKHALPTAVSSKAMLLVVWCLGVSTLAASEKISPDVRKYLGSARALFEKLEYEDALAQVRRARKKSQSPEDDLRISLLEGIVLGEMGKVDASVAAFTRALGIDPAAQLGPVIVSPKVQALFNKTKKQVQKYIEQGPPETSPPQSPPPSVKPEPLPPVAVEKPTAPLSASVATTTTSVTPIRKFVWVPLGVFVLSAAAATVLFVSMWSEHQSFMNDGPADKEAALVAANRGANMQVGAWVSASIAAVALAATALVFFFPTSKERAASSGLGLAVGPGTLVLSGRF